MKIQDLHEIKIQPREEHYLTPGRHIQLIGSQNGRFIAFGSHLFNEMGGIWMHPIKLLDGFWLGFKKENGQIDWLDDAVKYENHAFYNQLTFDRKNYRVIRTEFSPQDEAGLIVQFDVENRTETVLNLEGILSAVTDLRPVWYSEEGGIFDEKDSGHFENTGLGDFYGIDFVAKDGAHDWFTRLRFEGEEATVSMSHEALGADATFGQGICAIWDFDLKIEPNTSKTIYFKVVGSLVSQEQTLERMQHLIAVKTLFDEKQAAYQEILDLTDLEVSDIELMKQFAWSKCHIEWLTVASEPVGIGLAAGIPDYSWWFGVDSVYALKGCLPAGFHKLAKQTLAILAEGSARANGNGRIIHEENSYGIVGNLGNTQETALFIHGIYQTYRWTGDREWLTTYFREVRKSLSWLLIDQDKDGDLFSEGFGVIEGRDLTGEVIDTAVYTAAALADAAQMAKILKNDELSIYYQSVSERLSEKIRTEMWLPEEHLFADVRAQAKDLNRIFDNAINQAIHQKNTVLVQQYQAEKLALSKIKTDKDQIYCFKNWVIETPLEMKIASKKQAESALRRMNSNEFVGEWGSYLSGAGDRRTMTISSAVAINSNLAYGKADEAFVIYKKVMKTFGQYLPGSYSEMSPDYDCFVQAWTAYAMISPMVTGFLGLEVDAGDKRLHLAPCLPKEWEKLRLKNVKIGQTAFDFSVAVQNDHYLVSVSGNQKDWEITGAENVIWSEK